MKKLTNKEKIAILKKMRANLRKENAFNCFCWAYQLVTHSNLEPTMLTPNVVELGLRKPLRLIAGTIGMTRGILPSASKR